MPRVNQYGDNDDTGSTDGDGGFVGMDSRTNPANLNAGVVSYAKNMRMDRATARPRKGVVAQNLGIKLENPPVVLPFYLPPEGIVILNDYDNGARAAGLYRGRAYLKEPITFTKNGIKENWTASIRGREYTMRTNALQNEATEREYVVIVFASEIYLYDPENSEVIRSFTIPPTESIPDTDQISVVQAYDNLIIFRGQDSDGTFLKPLVWNGDPDGNFESAPDAAAYYSIPWASWGLYTSSRLIVPLEYISINLKSLKTNSSGELATAETELDHGLKVGMKVQIMNAETAALNGLKLISAVSTAEYDNTDPENPVLTKAPGFSFKCDLAPDLIDGGTPSAAYKTHDEYILSGLLEPFEYDVINAHYRINKGSADFLVGIAPYQEGSIIVFMRKSIYLHQSLYDLENSGPMPITDQIGCLSRRTIATIGKQIFFLSDEGVYSLEIASQLDLTGAGEPLSKDIDDQIRRINVTYAHRACAVFCENRYYLAAPIDGSKRNNAIFVYNTINKKWESIDIYPQALYFDSLLCATVAGKKRVLGVSRGGGISLLEEREDGDEVGTIGQSAYSITPVVAELRTRNYGFNTPEIKRFLRLQADVKYGSGDKWQLSADIENPDDTIGGRDFEYGAAGETTLRRRIGRTGHKISVNFKTSGGRPELRQVAITANVKTSDNKEKR